MVLTKQEKNIMSSLRKQVRNTPIKLKVNDIGIVTISGGGFNSISKMLSGNTANVSASEIVRARVKIYKLKKIAK